MTALPQGLVLSRDADNKVVAHDEPRASRSRCKDTGENLETKIPVTLTIQKQGAPIKQTQTIDVIRPGRDEEGRLPEHRHDRRLRRADDLKVDVQPVQDEARVDNNSYQYPVIFSRSAYASIGIRRALAAAVGLLDSCTPPDRRRA